MSDPKPPRKGQFQKGNKFAKGRPKGAENKFGPGFREKLIAGIIASGEKKARKNGVNGKVDGFSYFVESLVDGNGGAAATLIAKMLPSEPPPLTPIGPPIIINVHSAAEGQQFCPGNEVLMPFEDAREVWRAFNAGPDAWATCLAEIRGRLTLESFENLSRVPPLERAKLVLDEAPQLSLVPKSPARMSEAELEARLATLESDLSGLSREQLLERASQIFAIMAPDDDSAA